MKRERKIKIAEVSKVNGTSAPVLPKYSSSVINSASGYAKATRPANVGQVSDEIQIFRNDPNFPGHSLADWKKWHIQRHENGKGIERAVDEAWDKFQTVLQSLSTVTKEDVKNWMEDLVYQKTYDGLMVQNAIIEAIANELQVSWQLATPEQESPGIDGFINGYPVQIKADSYRQTGKKHNEEITCPVVYYKKDNKMYCTNMMKIGSYEIV